MLRDYVEKMYLPAAAAARETASAAAVDAAVRRKATRDAIVANQGG
jgi:hypothetical protein